MGLDDLNGMDVPDNEGGRPEKSEESGRSARTPMDAASLEDIKSEGWWNVEFNSLLKEYDDVDDVVMELQRRTYLGPIEIRIRLEEYDIHETDWEAYVEKYPVRKKDSRVPGNTLSSSGTAGMSSRLDDVFDGTSSDSDNDDGPSDGLASLM